VPATATANIAYNYGKKLYPYHLTA